MTFVDEVIQEVTNPSPSTERARKTWEQKSPQEQLSGCRKAWYGAVAPILHALSTGEELPVSRLDKDIVDQMEGLFEATFESYEQRITNSGRPQMAGSNRQ